MYNCALFPKLLDAGSKPKKIRHYLRFAQRFIVIRKSITIIVLTLALLSLQVLGANTTKAQGQTKLVLAFYYAWYDPSSFGPGQTPFQPTQPYWSTDTGVIQRQVDQARAAGIDGFVQSWYGPSPNQTESNFQALLNIASASGFKAAVDFETGSPFFGSNADRAQALSTLLATHANHPAYLRINGKPIIFFWASWLISVGEWATIREQVDPGHNSIWIAEGGNPDYLSVFDGLHLYNIAWSGNPSGTAASWAGTTRAASDTYGSYKYWVATAMPGFNDSLLGRGDGSVVRDRAGGSFYQSSFNGAAASAPDMLIINSFNEWAEGSNIEPSVEFGNAYLDMTKQLSSAYKSGSVALTQPIAQATPDTGPTITPTITATFGPSPTPLNTSTPTQTKAPTNTPTPNPSPTPREDGAIVYEVVAGDTYIGIAETFGITLQEIYELNDRSPSSPLTVGDLLIVGYGQSSEGLTLPEFPGAVIRADGTAVYTVKEGDTPIGIAVRFGLELQELYDLNEGFDEDSILQIGQKLVVGRRPIPQEVGGSSDMPTVTASATKTLTPTFTPTIVDTPSPTVEFTAISSPDIVYTTPISGVGLNPPSDGSLGLMPYIFGLAAILAIVGGLFLYLGRQS